MVARVIIHLLCTACALLCASSLCAQDSCKPPGGSAFNPLKKYHIVPGATNEVSYILTKGTRYQISICSTGAPRKAIRIEVFDSGRKLVASAVGNTLQFSGKKNGIYYIVYSYEQPATEEFTSVLSFALNRKQKSKLISKTTAASGKL